MFRGPCVDNIRSSGIESQLHVILKSESLICLRSRLLRLKPANKSSVNGSVPTLPELRAPWGPSVELTLEECSPHVDLELRRVRLPSEEMWKKAHRQPHTERPVFKKHLKNRHIDVFGSSIGHVHVGKTSKDELATMRPAASMRTALTAKRKRGNDGSMAGSKKSRTD